MKYTSGSLDWIREQVKSGGFTKLRTRFIERLQRDNTVVDVNGQLETVTVVEGRARDPLHTFTDEDWQRIAHTYPTLLAAAKAIGCAQKAIKDCLKAHGVENPWHRA